MLVAGDAFVLYKRQRYNAEIERLRSGMSELERQRADLLLASNERRSQVMVELVRRQASGDQELHLTVSTDSGVMRLQREGALLRNMNVQVGPDRAINAGRGADSMHLAVPQGTRTIERLFTAKDSWEIPDLVYSDRGIEAPPAEGRRVKGALGEYAILLSGGTVIYSLPETGPLADSTYVMPTAIRASAKDLQAVFPNLRAGMRVYFY